jgi:hypothetical protein
MRLFIRALAGETLPLEVRAKACHGRSLIQFGLSHEQNNQAIAIAPHWQRYG